MNTVYIVIAAAVILLLLIFVASYKFITFVVKPKNMTPKQVMAAELAKGNIGNYMQLKKEKFKVSSYDEYIINGEIIPCEKAYSAENKYVIITHGFMHNRYGVVKYMHIYRKLGFTVIIYDNRGCGENEPFNSSMGQRESLDLNEIIKEVHDRYGNNIFLGIHGESMGATATINSLKYSPNVDFVVSDCCSGDLIPYFKRLIKGKFHYPKFIVDTGDLLGIVMYGFHMRTVKPTINVAASDVPMCIIHGDQDRLVPMLQSEEIYKACRGYSELHIVKGARHANSIETDREGYYEIIKAFVQKIYSR